jgi:hypothetical protein
LSAIKRHEGMVYIQLPGDANFYSVLLDSGSTTTCINQRLVKKLGLKVDPIPPNDSAPIRLADPSHSIPRIGTVMTSFIMHFLGDARPPVDVSAIPFEVMPIQADFLVGMDLLQHTSPNDDTVRFNPHVKTSAPVLTYLYMDYDVNGKPIEKYAKSNESPLTRKQRKAILGARADLKCRMMNNDYDTIELRDKLLSLHIDNDEWTSAATAQEKPPSPMKVQTSDRGRRVVVESLSRDKLNPDRDPNSPHAKCTQCAASDHVVDDCPEGFLPMEKAAASQQ